MTRIGTFIPLICLLLLSFAVTAQEPPYIIPVNGERVSVERILARPNGDLVVTINGQPREITREQYTQAVGAKPDSYDTALQSLQEGNVDAASQTLEQIIRTSAYQSWDVLAGKALIETALEGGNTATASRIYDQLSSRYGDSFFDVFPEMKILQWNLQIAQGQTDGLEAELTSIIRTGENRGMRGMAQIARGDLKRRRREYESAVLDYLRTVYFYSEVPELHAEALYKTAVTFSDIGDTGRMRTYQQTLKETYPESRFAAKPVTN
jgi:TolA-binding protein